MKNVLYEHCEEYIEECNIDNTGNKRIYNLCCDYITNIIPYDAKETKELLRFFNLKEITNNYN
jgi:hypothetical protein